MAKGSSEYSERIQRGLAECILWRPDRVAHTRSDARAKGTMSNLHWADPAGPAPKRRLGTGSTGFTVFPGLTAPERLVHSAAGSSCPWFRGSVGLLRVGCVWCSSRLGRSRYWSVRSWRAARTRTPELRNTRLKQPNRCLKAQLRK